MADSGSYYPSRRSRGKKRRLWPWILLAILFFALGAGLGVFFASSSLSDKNADDTPEEGLIAAHDKATIMIMGVDEREDDVGRSDTLMIATIDPDRSQAALLSIPRDTRVKIKGHGFDKINAAYAYGGEKLTQDTVESFLGVNIDHHIIINVKAFQRIIDAIGGIDIDVEKRMYYEDPWDDDGGLLIDLQPGLQHMDGKTAVTYVRYRDEEGDIGRIERQQKFMKACMDKVTSPSIIPRLPSVISEVMDSVKTDLSMRQLLEFAGALAEARTNGLKTDMVPGRGLYIEGISYWIPDVSELRTALVKTLGVTMNSSMRSRIDRAAAEYESSIPEGATEIPSDDRSLGRSSKEDSSVKSRDKKSTSARDDEIKRRTEESLDRVERETERLRDSSGSGTEERTERSEKSETPRSETRDSQSESDAPSRSGGMKSL